MSGAEKLGKLLGKAGAIAYVLDAALERDERGIRALKVGPLRIWDRERWNKRPLVQRLKRKVRGGDDGTE